VLPTAIVLTLIALVVYFSPRLIKKKQPTK
jgi:hypothetical protein